MGSKIYVGGLPYSTTEQELSDLFGQHGSVQSAKVITDKYTGQSRGFGFVEMGSDDEAKAAIGALIEKSNPFIPFWQRRQTLIDEFKRRKIRHSFIVTQRFFLFS